MSRLWGGRTVRDRAIVEIGSGRAVGPISESHGEIGAAVGPISVIQKFSRFAAYGGETDDLASPETDMKRTTV